MSEYLYPLLSGEPGFYYLGSGNLCLLSFLGARVITVLLFLVLVSFPSLLVSVDLTSQFRNFFYK